MLFIKKQENNDRYMPCEGNELEIFSITEVFIHKDRLSISLFIAVTRGSDEELLNDPCAFFKWDDGFDGNGLFDFWVTKFSKIAFSGYLITPKLRWYDPADLLDRLFVYWQRCCVPWTPKSF